MRTLSRVVVFGLKDLVRNRWTLLYAVFFLIATDGLLRMTGDSSRALLSLMNIVLFIIPLVSVLFGTMYFYNSREFFKLLLAQPVSRAAVYGGQLLSLVVSLSGGFALGVAVPVLLRGGPAAESMSTYAILLVCGGLLTLAFVGLAFLVSVMVNDKGRGVALALFAWLFTAILYDGGVLFLAHMFSHYPLEKPIIGLTLLNPIDLARILLLIDIDISALMGYTGAVFERFFGSQMGVAIAAACLLCWSVIPTMLGVHRFGRKDL